MTSADPARGASPELRTILFYFFLFAPGGVGAVLSAIWFDAQGLDASQIGILNAAPLLAMLILNMVVGRLADRAPDWRNAIIIAAMVSALCSLGLLGAHGFWPILIFWTATIIAHNAMTPVIDAAAIRLCARRGTDFAGVRAWGTIGYLVMLIITGYLARAFGAVAFLPVFIGFILLRAGLALQLPRFRAAPAGAAPAPVGATRLAQVMRPWFVLPLLGWAAVFGTHTVINAFMGLAWQRQGIGMDVIGWLIALGAISETAVFFAFRHIAPRFRARSLMLASGVFATLRWIAMAFEPGVFWLIPLQAAHGLSFAIGFLACLNFITNWTSEEIAAETQGFFVMLQQGMAMLSLWLFGLMMQHWGNGAWWGAVALAALGSGAIWWSWRLPPPGARIAE